MSFLLEPLKAFAQFALYAASRNRIGGILQLSIVLRGYPGITSPVYRAKREMPLSTVLQICLSRMAMRVRTLWPWGGTVIFTAEILKYFALT